MSLQKLVDEITKPLIKEDVKIPINIGDTVLMGRFKNKKVVVKTIDYNEKGDLLINGRTALKFRLIKKVDEEGIVASDGTIKGGSKLSKIKKMKKKGHSSVPYGSGYKKVNESEVKTIHSLLQKFGNSSKDATDMIRKHYPHAVHGMLG